MTQLFENLLEDLQEELRPFVKYVNENKTENIAVFDVDRIWEKDDKLYDSGIIDDMSFFDAIESWLYDKFNIYLITTATDMGSYLLVHEDNPKMESEYSE